MFCQLCKPSWVWYSKPGAVAVRQQTPLSLFFLSCDVVLSELWRTIGMLWTRHGGSLNTRYSHFSPGQPRGHGFRSWWSKLIKRSDEGDAKVTMRCVGVGMGVWINYCWAMRLLFAVHVSVFCDANDDLTSIITRGTFLSVRQEWKHIVWV